ncbi:MAG: hypothetical protein OXC44_01595 [Proteobacteria bacterium]|nr:hypothetical protein [Pseudomonadota bacterium]
MKNTYIKMRYKYCWYGLSAMLFYVSACGNRSAESSSQLAIPPYDANSADMIASEEFLTDSPSELFTKEKKLKDSLTKKIMQATTDGSTSKDAHKDKSTDKTTGDKAAGDKVTKNIAVAAGSLGDKKQTENSEHKSKDSEHVGNVQTQNHQKTHTTVTDTTSVASTGGQAAESTARLGSTAHVGSTAHKPVTVAVASPQSEVVLGGSSSGHASVQGSGDDTYLESKQTAETAESSLEDTSVALQEDESDMVDSFEDESDETFESESEDRSDDAPSLENILQAQGGEVFCADQLIETATLRFPQDSLIVGFPLKEGPYWQSGDVKIQKLQMGFSQDVVGDMSSYQPSQVNDLEVSFIKGRTLEQLKYIHISWQFMATVKTEDPMAFREGELLDVVKQTLQKGVLLFVNGSLFASHELFQASSLSVISPTHILKKPQQVTVFGEVKLTSPPLDSLMVWDYEGRYNELCAQ